MNLKAYLKMRSTSVLLTFFALICGGCQSSHNTKHGSHSSNELVAVHQRLDQIIDAAINKDFPRLESYHLYGPKFTKFSPESTTRLDAEAARKGEHDGISATTDLTMKIDDLKIDLFDDVAIATFIMNYGFRTSGGPVEKAALSTLVLVKADGSWKIAHEHLSPAKPVN